MTYYKVTWRNGSVDYFWATDFINAMNTVKEMIHESTECIEAEKLEATTRNT